MNLIFTEYSEAMLDNYRKNITVFLDKWYHTDLEQFWESILYLNNTKKEGNDV